MTRSITRSVLVTITPTVTELAYIIARMTSDNQAKLISLIAEAAEGFIPMQLQYITDDPALTKAGRSLMSQIGAYAEVTK